MPTTPPLTTLYRPVGPAELELLEQAGFRAFPPRLPEQPIFYPVCNQKYAEEIAERWNARDGEQGFVTRFVVRTEVAERYPVQVVGARYHEELWVPAEELAEFNTAIVGLIEVIRTYSSR